MSSITRALISCRGLGELPPGTVPQCQVTCPDFAVNFTPPYINNRCSNAIGDSITTSIPVVCWDPGLMIGDVEYWYNGRDEISTLGPEWGYNIEKCDLCDAIAPDQRSAQVTFIRNSFDGDPTICCLNDYHCNFFNPATCFSSAGQAGTCAPSYRNIAENSCPDLVGAYCTGVGVTDSSWVERWADGTCNRAVIRNYTNNCAFVDADIEASRLNWAQGVVKTAIERYQTDGFKIGTFPGDIGYSPAQDAFFNLCKERPGLCPLSQVCAQETLETVTRNPYMLQWCGCNMPSEQYQQYTNQYQINPQCTPTCNRPDVIQQADTAQTGITRCEQSYCLIDNLTISLANTSIGGPISINEICGSCSEGNCACTISNVNLDIANSDIGGGININQACGTQNCMRTNPDPNGTPAILPVPCNAPSNYNPFPDRPRTEIGNIGVLIGIVVIIVLIVGLILWSRKK